MRTNKLDPWGSAAELDRDLALGIEREEIGAPPTLPSGRDPGERVLAEFSRANQAVPRYERFEARDVLHVPRGSTLVVGSPGVVGTVLAVDALARVRARSRARRMAAPQWHTYDLDVLVVTTHRLWLHTDGWTNFNFDHIAGIELTPATQALTLSFRSTTPLRLTGPWAPWIGVATAYGTYGPQARQLQALAPLRAARRSTASAASGATSPVRSRIRR